MAKIYNISDIEVIDGMLTFGDEAIAINPDLARELVVFDDIMQRASYIQDQPEAQPMPSFKGYKYRGADYLAVPEVKTEGELLAKKIEEAKQLKKELLDKQVAEETNEMMSLFPNIWKMKKSGKIVEHENGVVFIDSANVDIIIESTTEQLVEFCTTANKVLRGVDFEEA